MIATNADETAIFMAAQLNTEMKIRHGGVTTDRCYMFD